MNSRERQELDRHITGNYGEDQIQDDSVGPSPGPWELGPNGVDVRDSNGDNICSVPYYADVELAEANASLIAAAPELLDALELCVRNAECAAEYAGTKGHNNADTLTLKNAPNWPGIVAARAAIAKATGNT